MIASWEFFPSSMTFSPKLDATSPALVSTSKAAAPMRVRVVDHVFPSAVLPTSTPASVSRTSVESATALCWASVAVDFASFAAS